MDAAKHLIFVFRSYFYKKITLTYLCNV